MRRYVVFPASFALLLALFMAPFQHLHLATHEDHDEHSEDHDHDFGAVHAHQDFGILPGADTGAPHASSTHDHHGIPLDTFATEVTTGTTLVFVPLQSVLVFVPSEEFAPVEIVEERGHDPPQLDLFPPRAPPV